VSTARRRAAALAALVFLGLATAACNASNDNTGGGGGGGGGQGAASGTIALLLPESQTTRYESFDRPLFEQKIKELCADCKVAYFNANQQADQQRQQVQTALAQGAKVMVLDPVNGQTAGPLAQLAKAKNVPVISYDRLIQGGDIDYYVSFDNEKVGKLQGTALVEKLKKDGKTSGKIVMINGDIKDNNAKLFNRGAHSALDTSGFTLEPNVDFFTPDWLPKNAQSFMAAQISRLGKTGFVGVYAANDGTAGGAIAAMRSAGVKPIPPVTGQDAELTAIQRIVAGDQYMTVYKAYKPETDQTAQLAVDLLRGNKPNAPATVDNGRKAVPSFLLEPVAVTKENVKDTVVKDELWTVQQICTGPYASACTSAGLS
jgi:D-xylose transport system substrate-binding protein